MIGAKHIVLVYPVHWFGIPAWSKGWIDQTFTDGFALHYSGARKAQLEGKKLTIICTAGGKSTSLSQNEVLTIQPQSIARYTGMEFGGTHVYYADQGPDRLKELVALVK